MQPRISFGIIVLNGEPFTRYNLRALYPFAHQIIVVEGAVAGNTDNATEDGHSLDETLAAVQRFQREEDPENKVMLVTRAGFWSEKDEMSQAYAERATGNYLWQIDSDEFYLPQAMAQVIRMLADDPTITQISFPEITFWGSPHYITESWFLRTFNNGKRLFQWGENYRYTSHRPPTVVNSEGRDLETLHPISLATMRQRGIFKYHYSHLFPKQVVRKSAYYARVGWGAFEGMNEWAQKGYLQLQWPFRVHNVYRSPSWLRRWHGDTPPQIQALWNDIEKGAVSVERRPTEDVERLLNSWWYVPARTVVTYADYLNEASYPLLRLWNRVRFKLRHEWRKVRGLSA